MKKSSKPNRKNIAEEFAAEIIRQLKNGAAPWQKPWKAGELHRPFNPVSGTEYRGINVAMLAGHDYADPRWLTFKQAQEKGWKIKKGSTSQRVVFWQWQSRETIKDEHGNPALDSEGKEIKATVDLERPRLYLYNAFHFSQIQDENGHDLPRFEAKEPDWNPHERAEAILKSSGAGITHDQRDRAYYSIGDDGIHLPPRENFSDEGQYYSTALHELCHWTGHENRMNRQFGAQGTADYAKEELKAEIASWMICQELSLPYDPGQHLAYVDHWIKALEEDPYEIMRACQTAEKIKDRVLDMEHGKTFDQNMESGERTLFDQAAGQQTASGPAENSTLNLKAAIDDVVFMNLKASAPDEITEALNWTVQETQKIMGSPGFGRPGTEIESKFIEVINARAAVAVKVDEQSFNRLDVLQHAQHEIFLLGHIQANRAGSMNKPAMEQWLEAYYIENNELGKAELERVTGRNMSFKQDFDGGLKDWSYERLEKELLCREDAGSPWREATEDEWKLIMKTSGELDFAPIMKVDGNHYITFDGNIHAQAPEQLYAVAAFRRVRSDDGQPDQSWVSVKEGDEPDFHAVIDKISGEIVATCATVEEAGLKAQARNEKVSVPANIAREKTFLDVPFLQKSIAKKLGATWDNGKKSWCARPGADLDVLARWIPQNELEKAMSGQNLSSSPETGAEIPAAQKEASSDKAAQIQEPAQEKTFLSVPFKEKELAKKFGAKWDGQNKLWYAPAGADLNPLAKWIPEGNPEPVKTISPEEELAQALAKAGLKINGEPVIDGRIHRVPVDGGRPGGRDGAYCAYADGRPAGWYMNYRTGGEKINWMATGHVMTEQQKAELKIEAAQRLAEREAERQAAYAETSRRCLDKISLSGGYPAREADNNHPYLLKKGVENFGLPIDGNGNLLVPGINLQGSYIPHLALQTIQSITPGGQKFFEPGSRKTGAMFLISHQFIEMSRKKPEAPPLLKALEPETEILIAEGYATGASLHMATGKPVAVAFDAGNLKSVAVALREKFPDAKLTLCADNDHQNEINTGLEKAREAAQAVDGLVVTPDFNEKEKTAGLSDFNDLHQSRGLEAVARIVEQSRTKNVSPNHQSGKETGQSAGMSR